MKIFDKIAIIKDEINNFKKSGKSIGFVPTMGALHDGHIELVKRSCTENDITIVSIFVNPIQFNNKQDLNRYPRNFENDTEKLAGTKCDIIFYPDEKEMYPDDKIEKYELDGLDNVMEGKFRPGHFQGVVVVVKRFFDIIEPDRAYFGKKDFQQLAIIKYFVKKLNINIKIVECDTIRETDGLAMSSRNMLLSVKLRKKVPVIYESLITIKNHIDKIPLFEAKEEIIDNINNNGDLQVEYLEIVNADNLELLNEWNHKITMVACIAVWADNVRLIDNIKLN